MPNLEDGRQRSEAQKTERKKQEKNTYKNGWGEE
jgi:hypothetical protein